MRALGTSSWIEIKLFLREPLTVIFTLALPLVFLFVLGGVFGNTASAQVYRGFGPLDFYVPAYLALVWAAIGLLAVPVHLARYREDGVLRRLRASPAPAWAVLASQYVVALVIALAGGLLVIGTAAVVYDIHRPKAIGGVLVAWLLCSLLFGALGLLLSCVPSSRGALGAGLGLFFVMMMLSGTGPPAEVMTTAMHWIANGLPLTYAVRVLQGPWLGTGWGLADSVVVVAYTVGAILVSAVTFRWE